MEHLTENVSFSFPEQDWEDWELTIQRRKSHTHVGEIIQKKRELSAVAHNKNGTLLYLILRSYLLGISLRGAMGWYFIIQSGCKMNQSTLKAHTVFNNDAINSSACHEFQFGIITGYLPTFSWHFQMYTFWTILQHCFVLPGYLPHLKLSHRLYLMEQKCFVIIYFRHQFGW